MSIKKIGNFNLKRKLANFNRQKSILPKRLANQSVNHFKEGFDNGGGKTDASKSGWKRRKAGTKRNVGRAILVDSGALKRDIKTLNATWRYIRVGTSSRTIKYASRHNKGLAGMPKREFIGKSKELTSKNWKMIRTTIKMVFNG